VIDLELLACPGCGGALTREGEAAKCAACDVAYPIVDGVLDFLPPPSHDSDP
jgi:uncharacterized protein YbaR (Trm112 family)